MLTACSSKNEQKQEEVKVETKSPTLSADEVLTKFYEAVENITSITIDIDNSLYITHDGYDHIIQQNMNISTIKEPYEESFYMKQTLGGEEEITRLYFKDSVMYINAYFTDSEWVKISDKDMSNVILETQKNMAGSQDVLHFKKFKDIATVEEKEGAYIIVLKGSGKEYKDAFSKYIEMFSFFGEGYYEMLDTMNIEDFRYVYTIDKETFLPITFKGDTRLTIDFEGELTRLKVVSKANYRDRNSLVEITLPDEVKNAVEI